MRFPFAPTLAALMLTIATLAGCPKPLDVPPPPFGGVNVDAGPTIVVTPPDDDVPPEDVEVVDAGPANTTVIVERIEPAAGPLAGLNRIRLIGTGFTGACVLNPAPGSGPCDVWFGDVQASFVTPAGTGLSAISVQVPPGVAPGPVDVKVLTSLGVAVVENGYTYFSPLRIDDIEPRAGSTDGGDLVTLTGESFSDDMLVTVGGRQVAALVVDGDGRSATFLTPPGEAGRADVVATDAFGQSTVGLGFTYRGPLRLEAVEPNVVDAAGGDVVDLLGSGFFLGDGVGSGFDVNAAPFLAPGGSGGAGPGAGPFGGGTGTGTGDDDEPGASFSVTIGGAAAPVVNVISEERVRVTAPPLSPGLHDVVVTRGALSDALVDAVLVRAPLTGAFAVQGVVPSRFDVDGGTRVTLVGEALASASTVTVAGVSAGEVVIVDDRTLTFVAPPAADGVAGPAIVTVTRADGSALSTDALYVVPLSLDDVTPASGSVSGGSVVTVRGRGLEDVLAMTFGGIPAVDVVVVDDETITATTPAGAAGFVDVAVVNAAGERAVLRDGFRFVAPLRVVAVQPARGALNGNTFVTVVGSGFSNADAVSLSFADNAAREIVVVNDSVLTARTPPRNEPGVVDVRASVGIDTHALVDAFSYFRTSGNVTGGARGGPIDGAVYVSALDPLTGSAIPGLVAWVGTDEAPVAAGITDALGTATVSGPAVRGPQTVTIAGDCFGTVTFVDVDAAELTAFVPNLCPPPPPPPTPVEAPPPSTIRGRVFGFAKEFFDPENLDQSGCDQPPPAKCEIAFAEVQTSLESPFSQNPFIVSDNIALEEGDEYEITPTRTGRMAVVAIAGILDTNNNDFRLVQLGVRREINIGIGEELIDQDIDLDIALDEELDMFMSDAPLRGSLADSDVDDIGFQPTVTRVVPFLQLAGEGAYLYTLGFEGDRNMVLEEMPDIRGDALTFFAGAYTTDGDNMYTDVGTANLVEDSVRVSGNGTEAEWSARGANGAFLAAGLVFVAERPDGTRFASAIEAVVDETPDTPAGPFVLRLQDAPDFDATGASYHIGAPGAPSSEILQDGVGNITGTASGGVTLSPFLGLPEVITPARDGVLVDRMLRWRAPFGQQPSIHRHVLTNAFAPTTSVWQVFADGARTKVILPRIPDTDAFIAVLPFDQRTCLTEPSTSPIAALCAQRYGELSNADDFIAPSDLALGAIRWRHEQILAPNVTNTDWSFLQIGLRNRRAWTTNVHGFVHGLD